MTCATGMQTACGTGGFLDELAPGLFHDRLAACGADAVGAPLGADPRIAELIAARYTSGLAAADLDTLLTGSGHSAGRRWTEP